VILRIEGRRPTSLNASRRMHHHARATDDEMWRTFAGWSAKAIRAETIHGLAVVTAIPLLRGQDQDTGACYPSVKAAIDGIVDAGVLAGDTGKHLAWIKLCAPRRSAVEGLELIVEPALEAT
jgi:crossover junction endodeoxyribonuclease RusA